MEAGPDRDQARRQEALKGLEDLLGEADEVGWAGPTGSPSPSALNAVPRSLDSIKVVSEIKSRRQDASLAARGMVWRRRDFEYL